MTELDVARALFDEIRSATQDPVNRQSVYQFKAGIQGSGVTLKGSYGFSDPRDSRSISAYFRADPRVPNASIGYLISLLESIYGVAERPAHGTLLYRWRRGSRTVIDNFGGGAYRQSDPQDIEETLTLHIDGGSFMSVEEEAKKDGRWVSPPRQRRPTSLRAGQG